MWAALHVCTSIRRLVPLEPRNSAARPAVLTALGWQLLPPLLPPPAAAAGPNLSPLRTNGLREVVDCIILTG